MHFISSYRAVVILLAGVIVSACSAEGDDPGVEYAPQMYHSVPYEPLSQIKDKEIGGWLSSNEADEHAEFYNSNPYNLHEMTMRKPVENTVRRSPDNNLPLTIPADTLGSTYWLDYAAENLKSPFGSANTEAEDAVLEEGTLLFTRFCAPCHGGAGQGDGLVGNVFKGVPSFTAGRYSSMTEGHIFHVITYGRGRMNSYASQLDVEERWKIVKYVQQLQNQ
jgi:mono/diheme cytochrome c family protein